MFSPQKLLPRKLLRCRSLAAAEQLSRVGYGTLAWINGGLDTAKKSDLPIKGEFDDLRYGGIGGLSELLGWTDVQREKSAGFLGAALGSGPGLLGTAVCWCCSRTGFEDL